MEMTIDELGAMMAKEFSRIHEKFARVDERFDEMNNHMEKRFDRVETRLAHVEEICEDLTGRFISMDDRLSKTEFTLDEANPRKLKKRVEKLEKHTFGAIQPA